MIVRNVRQMGISYPGYIPYTFPLGYLPGYHYVYIKQAAHGL